MRVFDAFEQGILKKIKQLSDSGLDVSFYSLIDEFLEYRGVRIDYIRNKAFLLFDTAKFGRLQQNPAAAVPDLNNEIKSFINSFFKVVLLTSYLEREGYLYRSGASVAKESLATFAKTNDLSPLIREVTDSKIVQLLSDYFSSIFYISQGLLDHIKSGFSLGGDSGNSQQNRLLEENLNLTREILFESRKYVSTLEKNLEESQVLIEDGLYLSHKSIRYSDIALGMAILLGVIGTTIVGISTYLTFQELDKNTKKISAKLDPISARIDAIEGNFTYVSEKLDNIKIKDTIHTKLVRFPQDTVYTRVVNHVKIEDVTDEKQRRKRKKKLIE